MRHLTDGETTYYTYDKEGKRVEHKFAVNRNIFGNKFCGFRNNV